MHTVLQASSETGYCCPSPESQALGTPVIVTDTTAMPDNLYNGEKAKTCQSKFVYQNVSYWYALDVIDLAACLTRIYSDLSRKRKKSLDMVQK